MPTSVAFGTISVSCEGIYFEPKKLYEVKLINGWSFILLGYDNNADPYVLVGSCAVSDILVYLRFENIKFYSFFSATIQPS